MVLSSKVSIVISGSICGVHASEIIFEIESDNLNGLCSPMPYTIPVSSSTPNITCPPVLFENAIISFKNFSCLLGISLLNSTFLSSPKYSFSTMKSPAFCIILCNLMFFYEAVPLISLEYQKRDLCPR